MTFPPFCMKEESNNKTENYPYYHNTNKLIELNTSRKNMNLMTPEQFASSNLHPSQSLAINSWEIINHDTAIERSTSQIIRNNLQVTTQKDISVMEKKFTENNLLDVVNSNVVLTETEFQSNDLKKLLYLPQKLSTKSPQTYIDNKYIGTNKKVSSTTSIKDTSLKSGTMELLTPDVFLKSEPDCTDCSINIQQNETDSDESSCETGLIESLNFNNVDNRSKLKSSYGSDRSSSIIDIKSEPLHSKSCDSCNFFSNLFGDDDDKKYELLSELYTMLRAPCDPTQTREGGANSDKEVIAKLRQLFSLNAIPESNVVMSNSRIDTSTQENIPATWGMLVSKTKLPSDGYSRVASVLSEQEGQNLALCNNYNEESTPIGIFWDIENISVPKTIMPAQLVGNMRRILMDSHWEADFMCACNIFTVTQNMDTVQELLDQQVDVHHVGTGKNAADKKLEEKIETFSNTHGPAGTIVLITNDTDFEQVIYRMRYQLNHYVILVHNNHCPESLQQLANETINFRDLTECWFGPLLYDWVPYTIDSTCEQGNGLRYPHCQYKRVPRNYL